MNLITAKTPNHKEYIISIVKNPVTICVGDAGTGKSYIPLGIALEHIGRNDKSQRQIVITRPLVSVGKDIGSLPGTINERIAPYFKPAYHNLIKILNSKSKVDRYIEDEIIKFEPLELMRGMTYDKSFLILDEAQDTLPEQMLMFLTRMGEDTKIIINGDLAQSDIRGTNGLHRCLDGLANKEYVGTIKLGKEDQQRNSIITKIIYDFGPCGFKG